VERQQCETLRAQAERLQSELTSLQAKLSEAETREKKALEVMETMRDQVDERSAQAGQLREKLALAREREHELIKALEASRAELAKSENARHTVTQALTAMESLALDIKRIAVEARGVPSEPPTQAFAGLRVHMPSEAPEILIDGVMMKSEEERRGSESSIPTLRPQRD
jgi:chromosome segregation ATPase